MEFGCPPSVFWFHLFLLQLYVDSSTLSPSLLVHGFPCPNDAEGTSRLLFLVVGIFSSTPLPGFIGPELSVLSVDLPPPDPFTVSGSPYRFGFLTSCAAFEVRSVGLPWVRRSTSPYPVQLHFGLVHRISGLALPRLLDLLPAAI